MHVPDEIERRVARLLNGRASSSDLDRIFLWLREKPYGHELVREVGDLIAHWSERTKGIMWEKSRAVFTALSVHIDLEMKVPISIDQLKFGIKAAFETTNPNELKKSYKKGKNKSRKILNSALSKMVGYNQETHSMIGNFEDDESELLKLLYGAYSSYPIMTQESLTDEFCNLLLKRGAVQRNEMSILKEESEVIGPYIVAKMNGVKIISHDHPPITLSASISYDKDGDKLVVYAGRKFPGEGKNFTFQYPAISTSSLVDEWCDRSILNRQDPYPLEFEEGRIRILV